MSRTVAERSKITDLAKRPRRSKGPNAPLRLLRNVRGLELVELPSADECCGFGGTFSVKNADTSIAMLVSDISMPG
jgi:L-lactate dehydrogenase complex protein LldE